MSAELVLDPIVRTLAFALDRVGKVRTFLPLVLHCRRWLVIATSAAILRRTPVKAEQQRRQEDVGGELHSYDGYELVRVLPRWTCYVAMCYDYRRQQPTAQLMPR